MNEIWKDVPGYEGYYQVSNIGNVKSLDRIIETKNRTVYLKGVMLKKALQNSGYQFVTLCKNAKTKPITVHKLVYTAFNGEYSLEINHIDGDKTNNKLENLEVVTSKENKKHARKIGLIKNYGEYSSCSKITFAEARMIKKMLDEGMTQKEIASHFPITPGLVGRIKRGQAWVRC